MTDPELITRKASLIERDLLTLIEALAKVDGKTILDVGEQAQIERLLERMIGRMIDVNFHLITEKGRPAPKDYHHSFLELGQMKILDGEFAKRICYAAGLRNRIAHEYDDIDAEKLLDAARTAVKDIPEYLKQILKEAT